MDESFAAKTAAACFVFFQLLEELTGNEFLRVLVEKTADQRTIIDYHARGQTVGKGIINYHEDRITLNMLKTNDS